MAFQFFVTKQEAGIILNWYDTALQKYTRFGSTQYAFPEEEILVKLLKTEKDEIILDDLDLQIIYCWMEKTVMPYPGLSEIYFPGEDNLVKKIKKLKREIKKL
jgi:hypothetical protein